MARDHRAKPDASECAVGTPMGESNPARMVTPSCAVLALFAVGDVYVSLCKKVAYALAVFLFFADDSPSRESSGGWLFLEEADVDVEHGQDGDGYEADVAVEGIDLKSQEQGEREREIETDDSGGMSVVYHFNP